MGGSQLVGLDLRTIKKSTRAEIITAFSDCLPKVANKGYDVFDTPALALSHPLHDQDETMDGKEKNLPSAPDIVEETGQSADVKGLDVVPSRHTLPTKVNNTLNHTGNYHLSPLFERTFIDLGSLMVEEGFDLVTHTQVQGLLSEDWKFV